MERFAGLPRGRIAARKLKLPPEPSGGWGDYVRIKGQKSVKAWALDEARSYLRVVGKTLQRLDSRWEPYRGRGMNTTGVRINPGGPAVSGEAYGVWTLKGTDVAVFVQISPDAVDRLGIMWRRDLQPLRPGGPGQPYQNRWAKKTATAEELAKMIHEAFGGG